MLLSIIIINFNTPQVTLNCLRSVKQFAAIPYEVILVDNAPKEQYKAHFEECIEGLIYIRSDKNIGFGKANNLGMGAAKGKYFLLLNSDTLFIDNSLEKAIQYLEQDRDERVGALGCKLLNEDLSYQHSFYPFTGNSLLDYCKANNPLLSKISGANKRFRESSKIIDVGDISGAFMLLRKTVFEKLNGFDPDFFLYCEETDWCRNRIAKHYRIVYFPDTRIIHLGGKSAPKHMMYLQSQLSLALFWYKKSAFSYLLYILFYWVNGLYFLLYYPFAGTIQKGNIRQYLNGIKKTFPYLFFDIPKFSRKFNSRKEGLVLEEARGIFFAEQ